MLCMQDPRFNFWHYMVPQYRQEQLPITTPSVATGVTILATFRAMSVSKFSTDDKYFFILVLILSKMGPLFLLIILLCFPHIYWSTKVYSTVNDNFMYRSFIYHTTLSEGSFPSINSPKMYRFTSEFTHYQLNY